MPVDKKTGMVCPDDIIKEIIPTTCLVTIMLANNETGVIQPIKSIFEKIREINRKPEILTHTDAAQAFGKIPVSVQDLDVDYMTIVGHKVCRNSKKKLTIHSWWAKIQRKVKFREAAAHCLPQRL